MSTKFYQQTLLLLLLLLLVILPKLYYGREYPENLDDHPFCVAVTITSTDGGVLRQCTGGIISELHVFTSMKCVFAEGDELVSGFVRAGADIMADDGDVYTIVRIYKHEKFQLNDLRYNVAILKVRNIFDFTTYINQIPINIDFVYQPTDVQIIGFTFGVKAANNKIKVFRTRTIPMANCRATFLEEGKDRFLRPETVCVARVDGERMCQLSPGALLVRRNKLIGVLTLRINRCQIEDDPLLFSCVSHYSTWMSKIVQAHLLDRTGIA